MSARVPAALIGLSSLGAMLAPVHVVVAADYLSVEAAQRSLFAQADRFGEVVLALSTEQRQVVAGMAGPQPPHRSLRAWKAMRGDETLGYVFVDEVLGRQDMITYAAAIDRSGRLGALEIMSYRESHGGEIRSNAWRNQFNGRQGLDQLRFGVDIKNIAGATLSCEHVTQGVRWIAALWQVAFRADLPPST
jgi:FMN-binding domain